MDTEYASQEFASCPYRRYDPPVDVHVSRGKDLRRFVRTLLWVLVLLGIAVIVVTSPSPGHAILRSAIVLGIGIVINNSVVPGIRVAASWERAVVSQGTRPSTIHGPGIFFAGGGHVRFVDFRLRTWNIPKQRVITSDNVPLSVDGVIFFRIGDARKAHREVQDFSFATAQYAQAAVRDVVGNFSLDDLLSDRERVQGELHEILEEQLQPLGIDLESVRLLDIDLPEDLERLISRQASAEREKRATIAKAAGDKQAACDLAEAARIMLQSPGAMQLRTLQTIDDLGANACNTIVLMPVELVELMRGVRSNGVKVATEPGKQDGDGSNGADLLRSYLDDTLPDLRDSGLAHPANYGSN